MKELLVNPPFHSLMGQDQSYVPLSLLWAANDAEDPGIYNFEIENSLDQLSYLDRLSGFERYLFAVSSPEHFMWKNVRNVFEKYNPKEIWMTHYYAKDMSINVVSDIAKGMGIKVRINRPYEPPFQKDKINARRGLFESLLQEYKRDRLSHIFTSSGCPYSCGFCLSDNKVQFREISDIIFEMDYLVSNFSCELFTFWDDAFTLVDKRIVEFAKHKEKSLSSKSRYMCESRADSLNENNIKILKDSGCENISVGFETGSPRLLKLIRKGEGIEDYLRTADLLNKYGINWKAYVMIGFPTETEEEVNLTLDLVERTLPNKVTASVYTPYPRTFLSEKFCNEKINVSKMCHQFENINVTDMDDSLYYKLIHDFFNKCDVYNKKRKEQSITYD